MSGKRKFQRAEARSVAIMLCEILQEACRPNYLKIVGSIRRREQLVGDAEILFVPKMEMERDGLFDEKPVDRAHEAIEDMLAAGMLIKRLNVNGHVSSWGPENKHALHVKSELPVDLFATTVENWWVSLVIRTGSKETNLKLTTGAHRLGRTLNAYGKGITESDGNVIAATSEQHVFELCGVPYLEPHQR